MLLWPGFSSKLDVTVTRLRCPDEAIQMLHDHYDLYKHEVSGHDLIISDWVFPSDWVNSIRKWFKRCGLTSFKKIKMGVHFSVSDPWRIAAWGLGPRLFCPGIMHQKGSGTLQRQTSFFRNPHDQQWDPGSLFPASYEGHWSFNHLAP